MTSSATEVLVVGESLIDVVRTPGNHIHEYVGGSAANVAVALARLEVPVRFATSFGHDDRGQAIADRLVDNNVVLACDPYAVERTATALADIGIDGSASYTFDIDWRLNPLYDDVRPTAVHVCSISSVLAPGSLSVRHLVEKFHERATVTYDINLRAAITGTGPKVRDEVELLTTLSTLVKASDEDLHQLYPAMSIDDAAQVLLRRGPAAVLVTRGAAGATAYTADGRTDVATKAAAVVDTIGAGDTFMAGLIAGLAERDLLGHGLANIARQEWDALLSFASAAAAITVSRPGADPPRRNELD